MTEFPKDYSFSESERKWQKFWQEQKIYLWDKNETRENSFVVDTPPPTVSGQLHIGHVYSYTQADFMVRFKRMLGKNIFYPIGFDDNGLPTERLVEKQKQIKATNMAREQFVEICKEVVISEEEKFRSLFNQMALSVDWTLEYQTINPLSQKISQMSFLDLVNKGEVYRNNQPILWDPVDQTALAQADIEDQEKTSMMNDVIFQTSKGERIIIATTRPELLPACVAVFYNPNDYRYKHLQGQFAITPLFDIKVPILADDLVQIDKGTGLVMCCTFGDVTDITWWRVHNLPIKIIIDKKGIIDLSDELSNSSSYNQINGLKIKDARNKIIEILKEKNLLVKQVEITQTVKCAERSGAPLEILTIPQWFVHTIKHKDVLMQRANEINWHPKNMKIRLENWINGLSWDWCISRQRYFGVPFPVWYSKRVGEVGKAIFPDITQLPVDPTKDLPIGYSREEVEPDYDVMDTWATSAISPQLSSHGISEKFNVDAERHHKLFPADLRPQAHEIIRTWAFYTILKAQLHENTLPWKNIMISGWCLAFDRSKMSKSKGNIIVPQKLLEQYGADVMRYWTSKSRLGADTVYSEEVMKNGKRLVNKLWNACKFAAIHFDKLDPLDKNVQIPDIESKICHKFDQWLIVKLVELVDKVESDMHNYEYTDAMESIEKFFWSVFCDNYLEITKTRAYNMDGSDNRGQYSAIITLYYSIKILLKLLAPFLPHITEEIWQILYSTKSIHSRGNWSQIKNFSFPVDQIQPDRLIKILDLVRKAKAEKNLSVKANIKVLEIIGEKLPNDLTIDLKNVTSSHKIEFVEEFSSTNQVLKNDEVVVNIIY
ncbi:valine--tRNA ligase [Rickettsia endosymbiont of Culicoides newsteadi]|uniref:valine--tRNA ligase n=1 Tax=Rickettsia endosymbiont of Culicoides newsteadi TaxID=1961830 RepID=UPI000B9BE023|nr:valine--tRNA ligase [Rickettsia endosymbiont of Culicoides newsteadi]OZG32345.1 valine--tRNA ligase [Rickettsia endosymbiont of Culicoides newsteadi]